MALENAVLREFFRIVGKFLPDCTISSSLKGIIFIVNALRASTVRIVYQRNQSYT
jgi:hypothetical protein